MQNPIEINTGDGVEVMASARGVRNGKIPSIPEEYQMVRSLLSPRALVEQMWSTSKTYCWKIVSIAGLNNHPAPNSTNNDNNNNNINNIRLFLFD
jgi:hypothetical protein